MIQRNKKIASASGHNISYDASSHDRFWCGSIASTLGEGGGELAMRSVGKFDVTVISCQPLHVRILY
jgi:hypothetical protein